jgi:hypothetical protein
MEVIMKSKKKLFEDLNAECPLTFEGKAGLDHPLIKNETYGRRSYIYINARLREFRERMEYKLMMLGHKIDKSYHPGSGVVCVQVSYFKGHNWDK